MAKCVIAGRACPETNDRSKKWFCPAWQPAAWTNSDGEVKVINCIFEGQHLSLIESSRAANMAAAEINATRNEIAKGFSELNALAATSIATKLLEQ